MSRHLKPEVEHCAAPTTADLIWSLYLSFRLIRTWLFSGQDSILAKS